MEHVTTVTFEGSGPVNPCPWTSAPPFPNRSPTRPEPWSATPCSSSVEPTAWTRVPPPPGFTRSTGPASHPDPKPRRNGASAHPRLTRPDARSGRGRGSSMSSAVVRSHPAGMGPGPDLPRRRPATIPDDQRGPLVRDSRRCRGLRSQAPSPALNLGRSRCTRWGRWPERERIDELRDDTPDSPVTAAYRLTDNWTTRDGFPRDRSRSAGNPRVTASSGDHPGGRVERLLPDAERRDPTAGPIGTGLDRDSPFEPPRFSLDWMALSSISGYSF